MKEVCILFLLFMMYSFLGWSLEVICKLIEKRKFINRGFLIGPVCPIYGFGAILITVLLDKYKDDIIVLFIMAMVIASLLEYFTSYIMEKLFKARWWDYSERKFNLNGRICGENAVLFGLGGLFIIYIVQPLVSIFINSINVTILNYLTCLFFIIYITDTILSFKIINKLKASLSNIEIKKDSTQELRNLARDLINGKIGDNKFNINIWQRRVIKAFPNVDLSKYISYKKRNIKKLFRKEK